MTPQITKAFLLSGQFKKGKKKTYSGSRENTVGEPGGGAALPQDPQPPHLFTENSETRRPADCVLGMGEGPGHLRAQTKGQRCRQLHLWPPLRPRACCAPTEVPGAALTRRCTKHLLPPLQPGSLKANLAKSHQLPFSRTEFLSAHWSSSCF